MQLTLNNHHPLNRVRRQNQQHLHRQRVRLVVPVTKP